MVIISLVMAILCAGGGLTAMILFRGDRKSSIRAPSSISRTFAIGCSLFSAIFAGIPLIMWWQAKTTILAQLRTLLAIPSLSGSAVLRDAVAKLFTTLSPDLQWRFGLDYWLALGALLCALLNTILLYVSGKETERRGFAGTGRDLNYRSFQKATDYPPVEDLDTDYIL